MSKGTDTGSVEITQDDVSGLSVKEIQSRIQEAERLQRLLQKEITVRKENKQALDFIDTWQALHEAKQEFITKIQKIHPRANLARVDRLDNFYDLQKPDERRARAYSKDKPEPSWVKDYSREELKQTAKETIIQAADKQRQKFLESTTARRKDKAGKTEKTSVSSSKSEKSSEDSHLGRLG